MKKRTAIVGEQLRLWGITEQSNNERTMADESKKMTTAENEGEVKPDESIAKPADKKVKPSKVTKLSDKKTAPTKPRRTEKKSKESVADDKPKGSKARRPFPQNSLEEALAIPLAIKVKNNGKPFDTDDVAKACNLSRKNPKFFYLAASSRDYGLTTGSRDTPTFALTELGNAIVYPESAARERQDKIKAFFNVKLFKDVFDHYGGGKLPEKQFVSSVLFKKFDLDESLHDEFCDLYERNCKHLNLTEGGDTLKVVKREGAGADEAVVLSQAGEYAHHAFIIMPFSEKGKEFRHEGFFTEVLNSLLKPACNAADFGVQTAHSHGSDLIHHTIIRQLDEADLVIADLTDHNPNVLFELGIRIALEKPVLLIRAKNTPSIFDVDQMMRVCQYDGRLWKTTIETDIQTLTDNVKGAWENREKNPSYMRILKTGQAALAASASMING